MADWLDEEAKRAKKRLESLPRWARPVVTRPRVEKPKAPRGCTCGHPGAGCYCPLSNFVVEE